VKRIYLASAILALAALAGGAYYALRMRSVPDAPIPSSGGAADVTGTIGGIPYWLQGEPEWGDETLGGSGESMAAAGCTVTCVAMALTSLGHRVTPLELCRGLKARDGFTRQGYLVWAKVAELTNGGVRVAFPPLEYASVDDALRRERPVIAKIMLGGRVPHWVLVVGKRGSDYVVMDPLDANRSLVRLSDRSAHIHAIRVLERA
jgi:hypothetical protein